METDDCKQQDNQPKSENGSVFGKFCFYDTILHYPLLCKVDTQDVECCLLKVGTFYVHF